MLSVSSWTHVLILGLTLSLVGAPAGAALLCKDQFFRPIDLRYLESKDLSKSHQKTAVTQLLAEAFYPALLRWNEKVRNTDPQFIRDLVSKYSVNIKEQLSDGPPREFYGFFIYPGKFLMPSEYSPQSVGATRPGFTAENRDLMRSATITALILERDILPSLDISAFERNSATLRDETNFVTNFKNNMATGVRTQLQAIGHLTANRVGNYNDLQLMERILLPGATKGSNSIVTRYALLLAPAVIGPIAAEAYFNRPLRSVDGQDRLELNPQFLTFLKERKRKFIEKFMSTYERTAGTGQGCPVAHCGGKAQSGLQLMNEAFLEVFRIVHSEKQ